MNDDQRGAVANYLAVYRGQEKGIPRVMLHHKMLNHSFIESVYDVLLLHWEQVCYATVMAPCYCCEIDPNGYLLPDQPGYMFWGNAGKPS